MNKTLLHNLTRFSIFLFFFFSFATAHAQTVEITEVAATTQQGGIGNSAYFAGENLYFNTELGSNFITDATAINHIEFSINIPGTPASLGMVSLYLKNVPSSIQTLPNSTYSEADYTLVYTGSIDGTNAGWTGVNLTTEFVRLTGNNLELMVVRRDGVARTSLITYDAARGDGTVNNQGSPTARRYNGSTPPVAGSTALATSAFRSAVRFAHTNACVPPATPGTISGISPAHAGATGQLFFINPVIGADSYTWTVPAGSVITGGQGTDSIMVTLGSTSGNVTVMANKMTCSSGVQSFSLVISTLAAAPSNNGPVCQGSALNLFANASGGTPPYTYSWTGPNSFTSTDPNPVINNASTVNGGSYTVTVTDNSGTTISAINTTSAIVKGPSTSSTSVSVCTTSYTWNGITYTSSGDYVYMTTSASGCDSVATLHLRIMFVSSTYTKTDAGCFASATGSITITPTSGISPYTYRIGTTGSYASANSFSSLKAGNYRISIKDANGCAGVSDQVTIGQQPALAANYTITPVVCNGGSNGAILVTPTNGTAPYTYRLGTSGAYGSSNNFTGLRAASYRVYIQDANSCSYSTSVPVTQSAAVSLSFTKTDLTCFDANNGTIDLAGVGGTSPYQFRLGTVNAYSANSSFTNLKPGNYRAFVKDSNGCTGNSVSINIAQSLDPCNPDGRAAFKKSGVTVKQLEVTLSPNPSSSTFSLIAHSSNTQPVSIRVTDASGRSIYQANTMPEQSFRFGDKLVSGLYVVEIRQGEMIKMVKVIKNR